MQAAARNLTPVTLELGGKCPAVMTLGSVTAENAQSVIGTKIIKNGQICISADYCLVPRGDVERFVGLSAAFMERAAPDYLRSAECTGMISLRHMDCIFGMLEEARAHQCRIIPLEKDGPVDRPTRRMPISLVIDPPAGLRIMKEEIFGPILSVIPYDTLDEATCCLIQKCSRDAGSCRSQMHPGFLARLPLPNHPVSQMMLVRTCRSALWPTHPPGLAGE